MHKRGFTLIEVLVVVALIGVLAALGGGGYVKSVSRGRDTKRVEDMKKIAYGFESYKTSYDQYGANCEVMLDDKTVFPAGPPAGSEKYPYEGECTQAGFKYCAALENPTNYGNMTCLTTHSEKYLNLANCNFSDSGQTHYCVINVQ